MPQRRSLAISSSTLLALVLAAAAARAQSPDTPEPGSVEAIKAATTEARFITPWVSYIPEQAGIPSPTIFAAAFGAEQPVASNAEATGRSRNRRVEMAPTPRPSNGSAKPRE